MCSRAQLEIFCRICGTRSKAFLILLSFNSGSEIPVCKIVPRKSMLVASYKQGVGTEKMSVMPFIFQSRASAAWKRAGTRSADRDPHATRSRVRGHGVLCRASDGPRTSDCGPRVLPPWFPPATDWREWGPSRVAWSTVLRGWRPHTLGYKLWAWGARPPAASVRHVDSGWWGEGQPQRSRGRSGSRA